MPNDRFPYDIQESDEEYRRRQEVKAKRRKKRQMQRIILLAAFALAAIILILVIVWIFRLIFGGDKKPDSSSTPSSISVSVNIEEPAQQWPFGAGDRAAWNLILVNGWSPLPEGYTYEVAVVSDVGHKVDARIAEPLQQMIAACNGVEGAGHSLSVISGARSPETQNNKYNTLVTYFKGLGYGDAEADYAARLIDPPAGYSEHETGLAVDFVTATVAEPAQVFAETPEYAWLLEHAHEYGFIVRYTDEKESITGIAFQPYHFRYVGVEDATIMRDAGICLEEYLAATPPEQTDPAADPNAGADPNAADPAATDSVPPAA